MTHWYGDSLQNSQTTPTAQPDCGTAGQIGTAGQSFFLHRI